MIYVPTFVYLLFLVVICLGVYLFMFNKVPTLFLYFIIKIINKLFLIIFLLDKVHE